MIDYHVHTSFSDGRHKHERYINKAIKIGLKEIGFSDHLCLNFPNWAIKLEDIKQITKIINQLKVSGEIKVKYGYECDYIDGKEKEIGNVLQAIPLDYVIGSVHYIGNWNFDTQKKDFEKLDIDQFYVDYFVQVKKAIKSGLFDIIGHIDLAKKFNYYPSFELTDLYIDTAKTLHEKGVAFELNTSGMDKDCKGFYPSDKFLTILNNYNVPVTLGSDSHRKRHLTRYFNLAVLKLKNIGFRKIATFTNRKIDFMRI